MGWFPAGTENRPHKFSTNLGKRFSWNFETEFSLDSKTGARVGLRICKFLWNDCRRGPRWAPQ